MTSSSKPLNQFQPNLVGSIFREWGFNFAKIKGWGPLRGKRGKIWLIFKNLLLMNQHSKYTDI